MSLIEYVRRGPVSFSTTSRVSTLGSADCKVLWRCSTSQMD